MSARAVRDSWLVPTLERLFPDDAVARLHAVVADSYWEAAVNHRIGSDQAILAALAVQFGMKVASLAQVTPHARDLIPEPLARKYRVVPMRVYDDVLEVATADPTDMDGERAIGFATGRKIRLLLASPLRIAQCIEEVYRGAGQTESTIGAILDRVADKYDVQEPSAEPDDGDIGNSLMDAASDRPVIKLVDYVLAEGITSRASDVHLEPDEHGLAVRYRIDGVLRQVLTLPRSAGVPLVSRIKIISGLDIADRLRPQDGRARVAVNGKPVDLRVSTLPAAHGEKVVVRILDGGASLASFEGMGINADELDRLHQLLQMREGIILVTGPTGSGKTTTLYTSLRQLQQRGGVNIVTVEDPVEYRLPGIVQVQVNEKAGLTFAAALRSILRQDPDVLLVGEIRDRETAGIAVQASLTGHLVFSTLHTLDALSSVTRLVDIGVESYKIAAAVKGIVAQRLLRRLCRRCRVESAGPAPTKLRPWLPHGVVRFDAAGCAECGDTGYHGRVPLFEVLIVDAEVERRISSNEPVDRIVDAARAGGMRSLWESGVQHVKNGLTSADELLRVLDGPAEGSAAARAAAPVRAPPAGAHPTPIYGAPPGPAPAAAAGAPPVLSPDLFRLIDEADPIVVQHAAESRILIADSETVSRGELRDLLEGNGCMVCEAGDGVAALEAIDRFAPDLVVLDLALPRLDGYGVLGRLRAARATQGLPVLVFASGEDEAAEERVFDMGADDCLARPVRPRAAVARIRALLRRARAAQQRGE